MYALFKNGKQIGESFSGLLYLMAAARILDACTEEGVMQKGYAIEEVKE